MRDSGYSSLQGIGLGIVSAMFICLTGVSNASVQDDDPFFGPWYNLADRLPEDHGQTNRLPADAGTDGVQKWAFVDAWLVSGPFKSTAWTADTPAYPKDFKEVGKKPRELVLAVKKGGHGKAEQTDALLDELSDVDSGRGSKKAGADKNLEENAPPPWMPLDTNARLGLQWPPTWRFDPNRAKGDAKPDPIKDAGIENGYFYATTFVYAETDLELWTAVGADDRAKVWVSDKLVGMSPPVHAGTQTVTPAAKWSYGKATPGFPTPSSPLSEEILMFRTKFVKGPNRIVVCCANDKELTYFWMRVCLKGQPMTATAAQTKAKLVAERLAAPRPVMRGFRNDSRNSFPDATPVTAWDWEKGINIRWRTPLFLPSKSCPVVVGDKVFTLLDPNALVCLDKNTGKILWDRDWSRVELIDKTQHDQSKTLFDFYRSARDRLLALNKEERDKPEGTELKATAAKTGNEWRSFVLSAGKAVKWGWDDWTGLSMGSPVTDGRHIWVKSATGVAACFDLDGNRKWMVEVDRVGHWHAASSPILVGDPTTPNGRAWVVMRLPVDLLDANDKMRGSTTHHAVLALDARTGAVAWRTGSLVGSCDPASPVAMRLSDGVTDMDVVVTQGGIVLRADDGKILIPGIPFAHTDTSTATVSGDVIFQAGSCVTAYQLLMLDRDTIGAKWLWKQSTGGFAAGLALHGGRLYGISGPQGCFTFDIFEAQTGFPVASEDRLGPLSGRNYVPSVGAGKFVIMASNGVPFVGKRHNAQCIVIRVPEGKVVARNEFETALVASPVFDGDRMYVRTDSFLTCITLTGEEGKKYESEQNARKYEP